MKIVFYTLVIIIITTIGLYFINPTLFQSIRSKVTNKFTSLVPVETLQPKTKVYKWQNNKGEMQFTNTPPPKGIKFTTELIPNGTNVMPSKVFTGK
jgi:hypothetical protein